MHFPQIKKMIALLGTMLAVSTLSTPGFGANNPSTDYLFIIAKNTGDILQKVNTLPVLLGDLALFALAWTQPDTSQPTTTMQSNFTQLGNLLNQDLSTQITMQKQLNNDLLGSIAPVTFPSANDVVYSTLLGTPYFSPDPRNSFGKGPTVDPLYNYIKNAAGMNINHVMPTRNWNGSLANQTKYLNYYTTTMAVESFNGYALSNQYADGNQFNTLQTTLINQATDPKNWFAQVASENIGIVLRQLLLYQSQAFILLTQLVQTQKQLLTAQVMTNSLLILGNQTNETMLLARAQGTQPTP